MIKGAVIARTERPWQSTVSGFALQRLLRLPARKRTRNDRANASIPCWMDTGFAFASSLVRVATKTG